MSPHLLTIPNSTQGALHVTLTLWWEIKMETVVKTQKWVEAEGTDYRVLSQVGVRPRSTTACNLRRSSLIYCSSSSVF